MDGTKKTVIDLDLEGLPKNCDETQVKKLANVKHVISTDLEFDNFKGECKGNGRVKIRLNEGETFEQVKANYEKAGFKVKAHTEDPRKRPVVTGT
jgi:hypothetical protein